MTTPKFERVEVDPETFEYFVNGESVGIVDHDGHGWDGMEAVANMFDKIAAHLGVEVINRMEGEDE